MKQIIYLLNGKSLTKTSPASRSYAAFYSTDTVGLTGGAPQTKRAFGSSGGGQLQGAKGSEGGGFQASGGAQGGAAGGVGGVGGDGRPRGGVAHRPRPLVKGRMNFCSPGRPDKKTFHLRRCPPVPLGRKTHKPHETFFVCV